MSYVKVQEGESLDNALRRFRQSLAKTGKLREARRHERFEKPSAARRRKAAQSRRRQSRSR